MREGRGARRRLRRRLRRAFLLAAGIILVLGASRGIRPELAISG